MEATELALTKCHQEDQEALYSSDDHLKDLFEQRAAMEWDSYEDDVSRTAEEVEMLSWYQMKTGPHLHRLEAYRAYEAYRDWFRAMQEEGDFWAANERVRGRPGTKMFYVDTYEGRKATERKNFDSVKKGRRSCATTTTSSRLFMMKTFSR